MDNDTTVVITIRGECVPTWDVSFEMRVDVGSHRVVAAVARAHALAEVIRGIPVTPLVRSHFDSLNILRAVRGTTGIEGGDLSETEAAEVIAAADDEPVLPPGRARMEQEARNAHNAMRAIHDELTKNPGRQLDEALIREIHRLTTDNIDYAHNQPGHYRSHAVSVGDYTPPRTHDEIEALMQEFLRWFREDEPSGWDGIVRAIAAHFYLVSIHPFGDGNGRTARAVESFLLYRAGVNAFGFYSLANFYYRERDRYIQELTDARFDHGGDLTPFIVFGLEGLVAELEFVHREVLDQVKVTAYRDYAREMLDKYPRLSRERRARMLELVHDLAHLHLPGAFVGVPGMQVAAALYRGVGDRTFRRDLKILTELELVVRDENDLVANIDVMDRFIPA